MAKLSVFNLVSLNGFFKGPNEDISWHNFGEDEQELSNKLSNAGNTLIFGRITYELMARYWPSAEALKSDPVTAKGMNEAKKIVFSRTLARTDWQNTTLIKTDLPGAIRQLKSQAGPDLTILGSGRIVTQLADAGLIDVYSLLVNPLVLAEGTSLFAGLQKNLRLHLEHSRPMKSGNVLLTYSFKS